MSSHTLAVIYLAALLFSLGCSFGYPKDTRPWNSARVAGNITGIVGLIAVLTLVVRAL